nr:reverse transcriptase domain-containing protein [Tanacetum cinerariifolium]
MRTRSQSRNNFPQQEASPAIVEPLHIELPFLEDQFQEDPPVDPPEVLMADNRTMAKLLQAPTEGYEDAIVILEIAANNFELKHSLINLVQNKQFFRHDKEDPHAHIRYFNKITSTTRVPNDSLNSAAGGNVLDKMPRECLKIIESKSKVRQARARAVVAKTRKTNPQLQLNLLLLLQLKQLSQIVLLAVALTHTKIVPLQAKTFIETTSQRSGTLPSNTITNLKKDLKGITTRSSVAYQRPPIPTQSKVMKQGTEPVVAPVSVLMPNLKPSIPYPLRRDNKRRRDQANKQIEKFYEIFNDMSFEINFTDALILMPKFASTLKALIGNKEKLSEMARTPMNEHCSAVILNMLPRKLGDTGKFLIPYEFPGMDECLALADLEYSQEVLGFSDTTVSGNPTPHDDLFVSTTSHTLTPFEDSDFLLFEEADAFLGLEDYPNSPKINPFYYDPEGDILLLESILNGEPFPPLPNHEQYLPSFKKELKVCEAKTVKSSVDEPLEVELKDLPPHLEYAFLEGDNKLPVIISKELRDEEKSALIKVLKSHKRAIAWKLSDIQGINPEFCTHKILMEEDYKPAMQHQRQVNPKIHDVIKKEVQKLLDAGLIYLISDSPWVSSVHCVPKKGGFTVVENEENELIPTRLVTGWWVCIDYQKLNEATRKDHFPLPFMDQMLERLAGNEFYCFLDGFFGYFQISIDPRDQEKTTFTCPYETFAYRRMPF